MDSKFSIHYQRRWFYILWASLLMASAAFLLLWETPARRGTSKITLGLVVKGLPPQTRVEVWTGPKDHWPGLDWKGQDPGAKIRIKDEWVVLEPFVLPVAYRRWVKGTIPRHTADLLVLRFDAPGQSPRYMALPLKKDWESGLLSPGRILRVNTEFAWEKLWLDPSRFSELE